MAKPARAGFPVGLIIALVVIVALLSTAPFVAGFLTPKARQAADGAQTEAAKDARTARERDAVDFAALGPNSSVADYLPYAHTGTYGDRALEGIQKVKSRQADAVALLENKPLGELADLWQFNIAPTRQLCEAYGNALNALANRIVKTQGDYLAAAVDIEWQMPNLKWLMTAKCDLSGPLERAEANIRAVADSDRLANLADTLADIRNVKR